jgi:hypothetical protein
MARAYRTRTVLVIMLAVASCKPGDRTSIAFVDLLDTLPSAERRAALPVDSAIRVDLVGPQGDLRPAIVTATPARVIWSTRLPSRARLDTAVLLVDDGQGLVSGSATARIGISDDRRYEQLAIVPLDGAARPRTWQTVSIDLGAYSGWQWSVFYRPWKMTWRVVFSADGERGGYIAWARPMVTSK